MSRHTKEKQTHSIDYADNNPVAKYAFKFNKTQLFKDRKNTYSRQTKHKKKESFEIALWINNIISKDPIIFATCLLTPTFKFVPMMLRI